MIKILKILANGLLITAGIIAVISVFLVGFKKGYDTGLSAQLIVNDKVSSTTAPTPTPKPSVAPTIRPKVTTPSWGGPELWAAINKSRVEHGVGPLQVREEVCTIASIRLNELLELKKLDGHIGFSNMPTTRPDLKWIFEKYNLSEFLVSGATSATDAVSLWLNTLGHKQLLTGGEYSYGCAYAQNGFGVAIAAY